MIYILYISIDQHIFEEPLIGKVGFDTAGQRGLQSRPEVSTKFVETQADDEKEFFKFDERFGAFDNVSRIVWDGDQRCRSWVLEESDDVVTVPIDVYSTLLPILWKVRSRLYQSQFLQPKG